MLLVLRHPRASAVAAIVAALCVSVGCSRGPAPVATDEPPPEVTIEEVVEPAKADAAEPATEIEVEDTTYNPDTGPDPPLDEPVPDPPTTEVGEPADEAQEIVVDLGDEEKAALAAAAEADLQEAVQAVRGAQTRALSPEKLETLATVEGLVAAARDALGADDIQAAATLANKAKLLAAELGAD